MNCITLITNIIDQEFDEFKSNLNSILDHKISEKKSSNMLEHIETVFAIEKDLNNDEIDSDILDVVRESIKQRNNISLLLEDNSEVILKSKDSEKIIEVFDLLDESNQINLINNLKKTKINFEETINFCTSVKQKKEKLNVR